MKRNKAWLGTALTAAQMIYSANREAHQRKKELLEQNKRDALDMAHAVQNGFNDQSYADEYNDKLTFRTGGRFSSNQVSYRRKFSCGGRKH